MGKGRPSDQTDAQQRGDIEEARSNEGGRVGGTIPPRPEPSPREDAAKPPGRPD
jgi:hypothetical protein